jgi:hypothetical protein
MLMNGLSWNNFLISSTSAALALASSALGMSLYATKPYFDGFY